MTLCLCATWIFLYVTMVTRIKISVLVSALMATFLLGLEATSGPCKSPTKEATPTSRKLCEPASWLPLLCRNLIYLSPLRLTLGPSHPRLYHMHVSMHNCSPF